MWGSFIVMLLLALTASGQELLHGIPAYESGWRSFVDGDVMTFYHGISGDIDDYVVDLQFRDTVHPLSGLGVHQRYYGGDDRGGAWWQELTPVQISVARVPGDEIVGQFRLRIWVVPTADYDSDWTAIPHTQNRATIETLDHDLGGDTDDYVVYLEFKDAEVGGRGIHNHDYGGDQSRLLGSTIHQGTFWANLTDSLIYVQRNDLDSWTDHIRVRVWQKPTPDWDSGWVDMETAVWDLEHGLGGPWNDYVVDLQYRSVAGEQTGQYSYGGDSWMDDSDNWVHLGTSWSNLTASHVSLLKIGPSMLPYHARIRIWTSRRPKFDSGWVPVDPGGGHQFEHNLRGDTDAYFIDLTFRDTASGSGAGVNRWGYGGDAWYDNGSGSIHSRGGSWSNPTSTVVQAFRKPNDTGADEMRMRIWIPPQPEFDSGWEVLSDPPGDTVFNFPSVDSADDLVFDLQSRSVGCGVTHQWYGLDQWSDGAQFISMGAAWKQLAYDSLVVQRAASGNCTDEARVRTWSNTAFEYDSGWVPITGCDPLTFSLAEPASDLVVDLEMYDYGAYGVHNLRFGGDTVRGTALQYHGAHWERLGADEVWVCKGADDSTADLIRVRVLNTSNQPGVFNDGFESGDTSAWSSSTP